MAHFGGVDEFTTWDGEPVSRDRPHGATIIVASRSPSGWRYVLLHRAHHGPAWDGDWAWTPPAGSRKPGEPILACAIRELHEESGLEADPAPVRIDGTDWALFALEVPWETQIAVDGTEHDRFEWVTYDQACARCRPREILDAFIEGCAALGSH
ncbi:MAG TPA: NUDIX domain-containing protein [Streptosporangiaceae bacterium]|nr:NUDIX domain-containing protein [Streptosporangiaceae bacterium]